MLKIVDSVYKTIGNLTSLKPGEENAEKRVEKIFLNFDKDKDGLLDFNEFEEALKSDTDILNAFSIYD
jgi:Ca2+-binding EF-hand superfamily protein